jgi:hypothetical protein
VIPTTPKKTRNDRAFERTLAGNGQAVAKGANMRIAIFSDIHGNLIALKTLLEHLQVETVDAIYCLGDLFTPYPGSREIWDLINTYHVQCVLGNSDVELLAYDQGTRDFTSDETRFRPILKKIQEVACLSQNSGPFKLTEWSAWGMRSAFTFATIARRWSIAA